MKPTDTLILAIIGHLVGDFLLQNDYLAQGKKRDSFLCCLHAWIWTLSVCAFAGWWNWGFVSILFLTHFIQDRWDLIPRWMKLIGQKEFMRCDEIRWASWEPIDDPSGKVQRPVIVPGLGPWSLIIVDQVWHLVTLWAVWRFVA